MSEYPVYPKAPITEAVMDLRVQLDPDTDPKCLQNFNDHLENHFKERQEQRFFKGGLQLSKKDEDPVFSSQVGTQGYIFRSDKEKKVIQAQIDGFVFKQIKAL